MNPDDYETLPTDNIGTHMTAGAIAGIMEHCVMYPLDSVKTRMQSLAATGTEGIGQTLLNMVRKEGILRPVRGVGAMALGAGPAHAVYFSSYEFLKETMKSLVPSSYHTLCYGTAGCFSTLLHDAVMTPAEVVKQRLQMANSPYRSVMNCILKVYRTEGIVAFYRSYTTQLTMNVPFQSIHFMVYEYSQKVINEQHTYNPPAHMFSGAVAGGVAAALTTPLDVCKTVLNTQQNIKVQGLIQALQLIYRLKGLSGYFRGLQARIMYQMPATAICWSTYEFFKYALGSTQEMRITGPTTTVLAEEHESKITDKTDNHHEKSSYKSWDNCISRDLPAMTGAGLYNPISFNTMHKSDFRQKDSILDIIHT